MKGSFFRMLGIALGVVLITSLAPQTRAGSIVTHGSICHNLNAAEVRDIDYMSSGVRNISTEPRTVICTIPRSPLADGVTMGTFFVDGSNIGGARTNCTLSSFDFDGEFLGAVSFSSALANYDSILSLPLAQLPQFAYTNLICTLAGNGASTLRGITAL